MTQSISIKSRLLLIMCAAMAGMILIAALALQSEKSTLLDDRRVKTRHLVETAHSLLNHYYNLQQKGTMSEGAAKDAAMQAIRDLRYEGNEYFWLNDFTAPVPKMLMHPTAPALDGKVMDADKYDCCTSIQGGVNGEIEMTDGKKNLFIAFNEVANKSGQGYVTYNWPKPKADGGVTTELYSKLSFVKKFDGWNWLVGSGIYLDDIETTFWNHAFWLIAIILLITALIGSGMTMIIRRISGSLQALEQAMLHILSSNDLSKRVKVFSSDEIGRIGHSFNQMIESFQEIIQQVLSNTDGVIHAAGKLSESSQRVAERSQSQSDATSAMAAAVEQVTTSISHVADSSHETHDIAYQSGELSAQGGSVVHSAAQEMSKIADSVNQSSQFIEQLGEHSKQISAIVNVIKEIADQTNLLALNAAIEAARAGEQGRGFAVVADEVRKLAERTARSTGEITGMIGNIQAGTQQAVASMQQGCARVSDGVAMANRAGDSMSQIRDGANRVISAVSEISAALREQSTASSEVAQKVELIARMTEENSAAAHEIADEARLLETLSGELKNAVSRFKA
jgi:methyl-accepting chemotaxis protein